MKENLFEMLLNLFERSLAQLKKKDSLAADPDGQLGALDDAGLDSEPDLIFLKQAEELSTRVLTQGERVKLTKASYQFLMRMKQWGVVDSYHFELILNQLQFSDSRIVTLQETKWTIHNVLADSYSVEQLAFLDLVLYQKEDQLSRH